MTISWKPAVIGFAVGMVLLTLVPAVAAENPGYSAPDTTIIEAGAQTYQGTMVGAVSAYNASVTSNAMTAVSELQALRVPTDQLSGISTATETFGLAVIEGTRVFVNLGIAQSAGMVALKVQETGAIGVATLGFVGVTSQTVGNVVRAGFEAVCQQPAAGAPACAAGTVVNQTFVAVNGLVVTLQQVVASLDPVNQMSCMAKELANDLVQNGGDSIPCPAE